MENEARKMEKELEREITPIPTSSGRVTIWSGDGGRVERGKTTGR